MDIPENQEIPASTPAERIYLRVSEQQAGIRLDHLLVQINPEVSRSQLTASIRNGTILVDSTPRKSSYKLKEGEEVSGELLQPPPLSLAAEKIDFPVLFEDPYLLVLSKPPGLVVHPGSGNSSGTLVNGLIHHCATINAVGDSLRPGIVHRLDKDTSGVMVVAKQQQTHRLLVQSFSDRRVKKRYLALVHGIMTEVEGRVIAPIGRHPVNRQKMAIREGVGKYALSNWYLQQEFAGLYSLIEVQIETGRTHQIRVHMASCGHPVAGDSLYGPNRDNDLFPRQMLHAWKLSFVHPMSGKQLRFTAPLWQDFEEAIHGLQ